MRPLIGFPTRRAAAAAGVLTILVPVLAASALADTEELRTFKSKELTVRNLIGEIKVVGHTGPEFEVTVRIQGADSTKPGIGITAKKGSKAELGVKFPGGGKYVYPALGAGSRSTFSTMGQEMSWLHSLVSKDAGEAITVSGSGTGLEVWADLDVKVPPGGVLRVEHGVGHVEALDVQGDLELSVQAGHVDAQGLKGALHVESGSGHVQIKDSRGPVFGVDISSGHVEIADSDTQLLEVATGSGRFEGLRVGADGALIETGSGGVKLELQRMGTGEFKIDAGSGRIELVLPPGSALELHATTGSGGVEVALGEGVEFRRQERDEVQLRVGSGGARVTLSSGSGAIAVRYP